jgi:hypothetical protein
VRCEHEKKKQIVVIGRGHHDGAWLGRSAAMLHRSSVGGFFRRSGRRCDRPERRDRDLRAFKV